MNAPEGELVEIHGKKVKGVGLGNIFSAGPIKLRSTGSKDAPAAVKRSPSSAKPQPVKEPAPTENAEKVRQLWTEVRGGTRGPPWYAESRMNCVEEEMGVKMKTVLQHLPFGWVVEFLWRSPNHFLKGVVPLSAKLSEAGSDATRLAIITPERTCRNSEAM